MRTLPRSRLGDAVRLVPAATPDARECSTDEEILAAFERGDSRAAGELYDRLIRVVDGTICRILGAREQDHDDLVQSAYEQIVLTLSRGRFSRECSLGGWASAIACNVGLNALRARRRERRVLDRDKDAQVEGERLSGNVDLERQLSVRRDLDLLRECLSQMDEKKAQTILLHELLGHDLREIARVTDSSVAAAQSRLVRAKGELSRRMAEAKGEQE